MKREATLNAIKFAGLLALLLGGSVYFRFCSERSPTSQGNPPSPQSTADTVLGRVVGVHDGDTITVLDAQKTQHKVRLYGIDAPESKQDFGTKAKQELSGLVYGKDVRVVTKDTDRYGRKVGKVYVGDTYVNLAMVEQGMAWWYKQYAAKDGDLQEAETKAKAAKLGLWGQGAPTAPWQWRKGDKAGEPAANVESDPEKDTKATATDAKANAQPNDGGGLHWLNTKTGVRHNERCRHFSKTKDGRLCGADEGKACGECGQ